MGNLQLLAKSNLLTISVKKVLLEHSMPIHWCIVYGSFSLKQQSWVLVTEIIQPAKSKIFTSWPFPEKKIDSCYKVIRAKSESSLSWFLSSCSQPLSHTASHGTLFWHWERAEDHIVIKWLFSWTKFYVCNTSNFLEPSHWKTPGPLSCPAWTGS